MATTQQAMNSKAFSWMKTSEFWHFFLQNIILLGPVHDTVLVWIIHMGAFRLQAIDWNSVDKSMG